jgi:6-phosphogluconate dehydrogenase
MLYNRLLIAGGGITMQMGMIGQGRMGANMVRRVMRADQDCVIFDLDANLVSALQMEETLGALSMKDLARKLEAPRSVWLMVTVGVVDQTLTELSGLLNRSVQMPRWST